jgi:hypothetical protein
MGFGEPFWTALRAVGLVSMMVGLAPACSSTPTGSTPAEVQAGLAGTWRDTRTLVTAVEGLPNGYYDEQIWTFKTSGQNATLSTQDGSVNGAFNGTSWAFSAEYTDPRVGLPAKLSIEIIAVDPLKGTLENNVYDPTGFRPPSKEAFRLDGVRQ